MDSSANDSGIYSGKCLLKARELCDLFEQSQDFTLSLWGQRGPWIYLVWYTWDAKPLEERTHRMQKQENWALIRVIQPFFLWFFSSCMKVRKKLLCALSLIGLKLDKLWERLSWTSSFSSVLWHKWFLKLRRLFLGSPRRSSLYWPTKKSKNRWMGIVQMYVNNSWQNLLYIPQTLNLKAFQSFSHFQLHVLLHLIFFYMRSFSNIAVCKRFSWCWAFFSLS